jgi:hypothetical protein
MRVSDCCNIPLVFHDIRRIENQTMGLYICEKCYGVYEK